METVENIDPEYVVRRHRPFVYRVALRFLESFVPVDDLVQSGMMGLLTALKKFDPRRKVRLITYAVWWIEQKIRYDIIDTERLVRLPQDIDQLVRIFLKAARIIAQEQGSRATVQQIAEKLDANPRYPISKNTIPIVSEAVRPDELIERDQEFKVMKSALARLPEEQRRIVEAMLDREEGFSLALLTPGEAMALQVLREIILQTGYELPEGNLPKIVPTLSARKAERPKQLVRRAGTIAHRIRVTLKEIQEGKDPLAVGLVSCLNFSQEDLLAIAGTEEEGFFEANKNIIALVASRNGLDQTSLVEEWAWAAASAAWRINPPRKARLEAVALHRVVLDTSVTNITFALQLRGPGIVKKEWKRYQELVSSERYLD